MSAEAAVDVRGMEKRYGDVIAVRDVTFSAAPGEIFGLIGRNGAGKTTLVECLATLRRADAGRLRVLGLDPQRDGVALRPRIGVQLQHATLPDRLLLGEALALFAALYPKRRPSSDLVARLGLTDSVGVAFGNLSGGQRQRAFVALALVHDPEVVFLDELTTGLDPQARRDTWDLVRAIRERGVTVLLTTHFMDEAERLCDRIAIMHRGRIVALDTPGRLVAVAARRRVSFRVDAPFDLERLRAVSTAERVQRLDGRIVVEGHDDAIVGDVFDVLAAARVRALDARTEHASLEDAFLALTGERLEEIEAPAPARRRNG